MQHKPLGDPWQLTCDSQSATSCSCGAMQDWPMGLAFNCLAFHIAGIPHHWLAHQVGLCQAVNPKAWVWHMCCKVYTHALQAKH